MRARHGDNSTTQYSHVSSVNSYASKSLFNGSMTTNDSTHSTSVEELFAANSASTENASYVMHESIKHIAEEMSTRSSLSFAPKPDEFTSFKLELQAEKRKEETSKTQSQHWLSNATTYLFNTQSSNNNDKLAGHQFHEVMISSLNESDIDGQGSSLLSSFFTENKQGAYKPHGGEKVLKYNATFLPSHLIRAKMLTNASSLLTDENFVKKRVSALGPVQASYRHVGDMLELRREYIRSLSSDDKSPSKFESSSGDEKASRNTYGVQQETIDIDKVQREASQLIKDTVFNTERQTSDSKFTINMAICLSTIGESLLKTRQYRDAMIRLEEAVEIYKNLPNEYDVGVAMIQNSIAKIYSKLGDSRAALLKLAQAGRIYESMNATMHHDAIANSHFMATLFVESGDWEKAASKYQDIIAARVKSFGSHSLPVAKTVNDYAVVLAKHNKMNEAVQQYEIAREIYQILVANPGDSNESAGKFSFDVTLIDLNVASIKSKIGDYRGALECYEKGVAGLRSALKNENMTERLDTVRIAAQTRHLVSAIGRIGSLKMKLKNNDGALSAYTMLLKEVDKNSPISSQTEKAKAHVKCATIYRQKGTEQGNIDAVSHLKEALRMYTQLHGPNHKDTKAISSSLRQWQKMDSEKFNPA